MPQLTIQRRTIIVSGHHRRPRSTSAADTPVPMGHFTGVDAGSDVQQPAPDVTGLRFLFWSLSDQVSSGITQTTQLLDAPMPANDAVATAWYLPIPGPGWPGDAGYIIDAFSELRGDFIDDDFVDVSPDSALTSDANVVGWVPTTHMEQLTAYPSVTDGGVLPFGDWIGEGHISGEKDELDQGSSGYSVAVYKAPDKVSIKPGRQQYASWVEILDGIINDAPGHYRTPDGKVHPWPGPGPEWRAVLQAAAAGAQLERVTSGRSYGPAVAKLAAEDVASATNALKAAQSRSAE